MAVAQNQGRPEAAAPTPQPPTPNPVAGWGYFLLANAIAIVVGWIIYEMIFLGDFLDPAFQSVHRYFSDHRVMGALAAAMPFFASLLVGFGYARRASRRRKREAAARAQEERSKSLSNAS